MALDLNFPDVTVEDLDDWEEVVSTSIMLRAEKDAAKIDWDAIPPDQLILGTEALSYVSKPRLAKRVKHQELQDVTNCAASSSASRSTGVSRFGSTLTNLTSLATASKGFVPANTKNNTSWALRVFYCWCEWRNSSHKETHDKVPIDVLTCVDATALNKWLSLFVMEATRLFAANVPEKLIAERTGHRSTEGLRVYERTSMEQKQSVSDIIVCSSKRDFEVIAKEETSRLTSSGNPNKISFDNCENCTFNVQICPKE